ncbi:hypothetical protein DMP08_08300 [Paraeggerthella hongkongensis]|uniref:Uncharacterized protein n=1 Tax=Paraeggerthella hongkongensis TaxID=230658 RepID=A0A3N0B785_9ACTN|nr:hypothetical protein DMP08_08300 [Paraeggerthella hongkongensis]
MHVLHSTDTLQIRTCTFKSVQGHVRCESNLPIVAIFNQPAVQFTETVKYLVSTYRTVDLQAEPNTLLFLLNLAVRVQLSLRILA